MPVVSAPVHVPPQELINSVSPKTTRVKSTPSLHKIFNPVENGSAAERPEVPPAPVHHEPVREQELRMVWDEFAEQRKNQAAEYQILKREYLFSHPIISVSLTNPVEETLLENFKRDFVQFLRDRLKNGELTINATLFEGTQKKVIYTAKEKFEHLAEKNPTLLELKERLGLDWDF